MKKILILLFLLFGTLTLSAQRIRVACVGNSVTFGTGIEIAELNSYPAQLQNLLGEDHIVGNFGHPGATVLRNGHKPYHIKTEFNLSKKFLPNIVIIHLGLNDQGNNNWPDHKEDFVADYLQLIESYQALDSKPTVIVCKMTPSFSGHHWFEEGMRENYQEIQSKIVEVAEIANIDVIDLHEPLYRFPELYADDLHPYKEGASIIAKKIHQFITGDYGGLKLPFLFGENMVLQRNEPITIHGTANSQDLIHIDFNGKEQFVSVLKNGVWSSVFPPMEAGGPYKLSISSNSSGTIIINNVFIGEVWVASGQSNMDFKVRDIKNAETVLKDSLNPDIFLFSMDGKAHPSGLAFAAEELGSCNADNYFSLSGWSNRPGEILENFSAIGYSYAYTLQKELAVPIGIICNAVGGSTTQSWISRNTMETTHETIDLLNDTHLNPMVQPWVSQRKAENLEKMKAYGIKARHPFDPTLLFDAGILPLKKYAIKGVIWYQGESNAERVSFHSKLFRLLVQDWRRFWQNSEMPFYFVQLSSINRPTWGRFRDSQRRLLSIPNTAMAVSSDVGHPTNVHPKEKWIVGRRLALAALAKSYDKNLNYAGPLFEYVNINQDALAVHFLFSNGLKTSDGSEVKDVQIAGTDRVFSKANTKIVDDVLLVWSSHAKSPRYVKYGYTPYSEGNLINGDGFPASTFSNLEIDDGNVR